MWLADLAGTILLLGLTAYTVLGGADFGAGFWDLTAGGAQRGARLRGMIKRSMGPVWEANHVWLIFVLVVFWTAFPRAFGPVMETLYIPLFLAAIGIIFRGAAFALRGEAATIAEARALGATFAFASVLIPFFFGTVIGAIADGRVPVGGGDPWRSWTGPVPLFAGVLAVAIGAYMAAMFLAGDAARSGFDDMVRAFRARALGAAVVAGVLAIAGLVIIRFEAPGLYDGLTSGPGLAAVAGSALAGLVTLVLVWRGRYEAARYTSAVAVGAVVAGWGFAQRPDFLPGALSFDEAAAGDPTLIALLISIGIAFLVLGPSLWLLFRLSLRGRLDTEFRPITAASRDEE
ncbi:cytochrome d ubiquinol oxidase subunit II [Phytoactinopolyspora halotolerans]|uniref:Cytochrome d ubiquinol oxidase subunit II n=1 Tax=Phytoactinopolyspora halotolerans TaxID=1981512 RepID=A0A6L9S8N3_9ACTN|nr:cytochrome d ubiquinol oxidase subunit II [Phytoactinopolyspora halotolerans]NEE01051.1 cytochrome d ubiquinol oxidase subunit II [Phytoactinopolyspora halotolerans]